MKWCCYYSSFVIVIISISAYNFWFRKKFKKYVCRVKKVDRRLLVESWRALEEKTTKGREGRITSSGMNLDGIFYWREYRRTRVSRMLKDNVDIKKANLDDKKPSSSDKDNKKEPESSSGSSSIGPIESSSSSPSSSSSTSTSSSSSSASPAPPPSSSSSASSHIDFTGWISVGNPLTYMPLCMGLLYLIMSILMTIYSLTFFYFLRIEVGNPYNLSKTSILRFFLGIIIRMFPILMKLIHYLIFFIIIRQAYLIYSNPHCKNVTHINKIGFEVQSRLLEFSYYSLYVYTFYWVSLSLYPSRFSFTLYSLPGGRAFIPSFFSTSLTSPTGIGYGR